MTKINEYININKQKPVETVQEANENNWWLKKQVMIKKSSLSTSARSKAINKNGSNLQSGKESYGPCEYSSCPHSSNRRFYVKIGFAYTPGTYTFELPDRWDPWLTMENIGQAHDYLRKLESGEYWVVEASGSKITSGSQKKQGEVMSKIQKLIESHQRGNSVYEPFLNFDKEKDESCTQS